MNLEQYWRVLSNPKIRGYSWLAYDNGWLSCFDGDFTHVFTPEGKEFLTERIKEIMPFENGLGAVKWRDNDIDKWKIYTNDGDFISELLHDVRFLPNGLAVLQAEQGGCTHLINPITDSKAFELDNNIVEIIGVHNHIIYGQKDEKGIGYTSCKIKDDQIIDKQSLGMISYPFFFANGCYAFYRNYEDTYPPKGIFEVYNPLHQKVFSINIEDAVINKDIGRNHFRLSRTKKRNGVYSAETGERVLALSKDVLLDTYFESGAYEIFREGLTLTKDNWKIAEHLHHLKSFGISGAIFEYQTYTFIIDTALSVTELRKRVLKELNNVAGNKKDISYVRYLLRLLTLLY